MQKVSGSLGEFLQELFWHPSIGNKEKGSVQSQKHSQMVAKFLQGRSKVKAEEIVDLIYNHPEVGWMGWEVWAVWVGSDLVKARTDLQKYSLSYHADLSSSYYPLPMFFCIHTNIHTLSSHLLITHSSRLQTHHSIFLHLCNARFFDNGFWWLACDWTLDLQIHTQFGLPANSLYRMM